MPGESQFEIFYDLRLGSVVMRRIHWQCTIAQRLLPKENLEVLPGDFFEIGTLQFEVQRYNIGLVTDIGQRPKMEDAFTIV